jgi:hypothetical protein
LNNDFAVQVSDTTMPNKRIKAFEKINIVLEKKLLKQQYRDRIIIAVIEKIWKFIIKTDNVC